MQRFTFLHYHARLMNRWSKELILRQSELLCCLQWQIWWAVTIIFFIWNILYYVLTGHQSWQLLLHLHWACTYCNVLYIIGNCCSLLCAIVVVNAVSINKLQHLSSRLPPLFYDITQIKFQFTNITHILKPI